MYFGKYSCMNLYSSLFLLVALVISSYGTVFAGNYVGTGRFATNQINWCHSGSYTIENRNAVASWSLYTDLDVYENCNNVQLQSEDYNAGNNNLFGWAIICRSVLGVRICDNSLNSTYVKCFAKSNSYYLTSWTSQERQFNATHEMGHCWSLDHRSDTDSNNRKTVMVSGKWSHTRPNATDISLTNAIY